MRKLAKILIVLSILTLGGSGFIYIQHVNDSDQPVTGAQTPVYAGIAAGVVLLIALIMLNLESKPSSGVMKEEDDGSYEPYGDEEYEDEYEDEQVY